jgi:hypothetical protein
MGGTLPPLHRHRVRAGGGALHEACGSGLGFLPARGELAVPERRSDVVE